MPDTVTFTRLEPELAIDLIDESDRNVRKTQLDYGIEELKTSIEHLGLIHPVVVMPKSGGRFELVVGQRRLRAFKALGRTTIPAQVIGHLDSDTQRLVSFSENIHRRDLPYDDTIAICDYLFTKYPGQKTKKIETIAADLNISTSSVRTYLAYRLVPTAVQTLVKSGELPAGVAYRITEAFWPNTKTIEEIAKRATLLTGAERTRIIELGRKNPLADPDQIIADAQKAFPFIEVSFYIEPDTMKLLEKEANRRKTDVKSLVKTVVEKWVKDAGIS